VEKEGIERGQVIAHPKSITPHKKAKAEIYVLSKEEGGRHTPFFNGYRPQFYFRTTDVTGIIQLPQGVEMIMPGDNINVVMELIAPSRWSGRRSSPSARVAGPLARVGSRRSSNNLCTDAARRTPRLRYRGLGGVV